MKGGVLRLKGKKGRRLKFPLGEKNKLNQRRKKESGRERKAKESLLVGTSFFQYDLIVPGKDENVGELCSLKCLRKGATKGKCVPRTSFK